MAASSTHASSPQKAARPKVFGIGFHKTATSSLADALRILGFSVGGPNWIREEDIADTYVERCRAHSSQKDAFQDNPWPLVYREMDAMWPGAKFILTTRDVDKWLASLGKHFGEQADTPMRRLIYGADYGGVLGSEEHCAAVYTRHNEEVRAYFAGRDEDFLEVDLTKASDWQPLCGFLGAEVPNVAFPHSNSAEQRAREQSLLKRVTTRSKQMLDLVGRAGPISASQPNTRREGRNP